MDSIKGAIVLRARLEGREPVAQPKPPVEDAALPLFHWVAAASAAEPPKAA